MSRVSPIVALLAVALVALSSFAVALPAAAPGSVSTAISGAAAPMGGADLANPSSSPLSSATLWVNNTHTAATEPFQLRLTEGLQQGNGFCWMHGIAANLSNLEFQYANGSVIPSWVETPCSGGPAGGVQGVDPTVWLSLNSIAAGSGDTIAVTAQSTFLFSGVSGMQGEAPQLSPTYGEWDNGAVVFPLYDNFSGSTLPSAWSNVGFTATMGASCGFSAVAVSNRCLSLVSSAAGLEGLGRQAIASSRMGFDVMWDNGGNNGATQGIGNASQSLTAVQTAGDGYASTFNAKRAGTESLYICPFGGANFTYSPAVLNISTTQSYVSTLSWSAAGNWVNATLNYNWYVLSARNTTSTPPGSEEWMMGYDGAVTSSYSIQWARERYLPVVNVTMASTLPFGPIINFKNETLTLSGYNSLAAYLVNGNGLGSAQLPTLASTPGQPQGIYYVGNATGSCNGAKLPFYEYALASNAIGVVSCIVPLYTYGYNEMLDNEFYLEYGYDRALFFGTTASGGSDYSIELVNLTTGALLMWNTTGAVDATNQQPMYVGNNTVMVLSSSGTIVGWNLVSQKTWTVVTGVPSEANNDYWLPMRTQLIAVTAGGSTTDQVDQYDGSYNSQGELVLTLATTVTYTSGVTINFVAGIGYNATWSGYGGVGFMDGYVGGDTVYVFVLAYNSNGLLTTTGEKTYPVLTSATGPVNTQYGMNDQRYAYTSNWVLGSVNGPFQYATDLWNGSTIALNTKMDAPYPSSTSTMPCGNGCFEGTYAPSIDWAISYSLSMAVNYPFYKVVYAYNGSVVWRGATSGGNASSSLPVTGVAAGPGASCSSADLTWVNPTPPYGESIVNETVAVSTSAGLLETLNTNGPSTGVPLTALTCGVAYSVRVEAWFSGGLHSPWSSVFTFIAGDLRGTVHPPDPGSTAPELAVGAAGIAVVLLALLLLARRPRRSGGRRAGRN